MAIKVSNTEATELATQILLSNQVPMIHGKPGQSKSSIAKAIAKKLNLKLIDVRLSTFDPVFLSGLPSITGSKVEFKPMKVFPVEGDKVPDGFNGWLCHHKDTEVLTKDFGFIKFSELPKGIEVAQYDMQTKEISYAIPEAYVSYHKEGNMVQNTDAAHTKYCITEDHDLIIQSKPTKRQKTWLTYKRKPLETSISSDLVMPLAGYNLGTKDNLTSLEKFAIAFQADGSINTVYKCGKVCSVSFGFSEERKVKQFMQDFRGIEPRVYPSCPDMTHFVVPHIPVALISKDLRTLFNPSDYSVKGCKAFLDYVSLWDGFKVGKDHGYSNTNKSSIDVVQQFAILSGNRASISTVEDFRSEAYSTCYKVHWYAVDHCSTQVLRGQQVIPYSDMVYCLKMPKATLITRFKDQVLISGNCFLDELTSCSPAVQCAAYRLVLDREHADQRLHPQCGIIAAGNGVADGAVANRMGTAMQTRLMHMTVDVTPTEWVLWASSAGLDHRVISYINTKPDHLHVFNPSHNDLTYRNPRTWHMLSDVIKSKATIDHKDKPLIAAAVGEAGVMDFIAFTQVYGQMPSIEAILANPEGVPFNDSPNIVFALVGAIAHQLSSTNGDKLVKFISRVGIEFQALCIKMACKRNPKLLEEDFITDWIDLNPSKFY